MVCTEGTVEERANGSDLVGSLDERQQQPQVCAGACMRDRAQLRSELLWPRERQRQAALLRAREEGRGLVGAEIESAHGRHAAAQPPEQWLELLEVLRLGGPSRGLQERELGPEQPNAARTGSEPRIDLGRGRRVAEECDPAAVRGLDGETTQRSERVAPPDSGSHRLPRLVQLRACGIDRDAARLAVEEQDRAVVDPGHRRAERDGHRHAERTSDDRGMCRRGPLGQRDGDNPALAELELRDFGRPELARNENRVPVQSRDLRRAGRNAGCTASDLADVRGARGEHRVRQRGQAARNFLRCRPERLGRRRRGRRGHAHAR